MRDYSRVFHTSTGDLRSMPLSQLIDELADAHEDLDEERRQKEKQAKANRAKANGKRSRPRKRR